MGEGDFKKGDYGKEDGINNEDKENGDQSRGEKMASDKFEIASRKQKIRERAILTRCEKKKRFKFNYQMVEGFAKNQKNHTVKPLRAVAGSINLGAEEEEDFSKVLY